MKKISIRPNLLFVVIPLLFLFFYVSTVHAILITQDTVANSLSAAITAGGGTGLNVTSATLSSNSSGGAEQSGTYTNASNTYGIGGGIVLSSGNVSNYNDGPNTSPGFTTNYFVPATAAQELLLDPITGGTLNHNDVVQLDLIFDMAPGFDTVFFNVVFGSDEYAEFAGTSFIDAFGLYVNGVNIASVGGLPVNIDHPSMMFMPGTELDGILAPGGNPVNLFSLFVGDASIGNNLTFILADSGDSSLDSTVYISALGGEPPDSTPIPEPATMLLLGTGLVGVAGAARRKKKNQA